MMARSCPVGDVNDARVAPFEKRPRQRIAGHVSVSVSAHENDYAHVNDYDSTCSTRT
jgi:hypothetical protein